MINSISGFNNFNKEILTVGSSRPNVFSEMLNNYINSLDSYQKRADNSVVSFIKEIYCQPLNLNWIMPA